MNSSIEPDELPGSLGFDHWIDSIDLALCDSEQVRFAGAIMQHSRMLIANPVDFRIVGASENALSWLPNNQIAGDLEIIFCARTPRKH